MTQYDAIFKRHSIRKFQMSAIDSKIMVQINRFIQTVSPLHPQAAYRLAIVEAVNSAKSKVSGLFAVEAPYYLVLSAKDHSYAAINAGYIMEQVVLYLVSKGLGTCYLGDVRMGKNLDQYRTMIVVAFGKPMKSMNGSSKRRKISELAVMHTDMNQNLHRILEAGRLAPSALNRQPWHFEVTDSSVLVYQRKGPLSIAGRIRELDQVSMGIVMCHIALAADELWLDWKLLPQESSQVAAVKGCRYLATLYISSRSF